MEILIFYNQLNFLASKSPSMTIWPPLALTTSEGAQEIFSKITFLKSEFSNEKMRYVTGFLFTFSLKGGVGD